MPLETRKPGRPLSSQVGCGCGDEWQCLIHHPSSIPESLSMDDRPDLTVDSGSREVTARLVNGRRPGLRRVQQTYGRT